MQEQGRSTLAVGDDDVVLDRLAGLMKVIPLAVIQEVLQETKRIAQRSCRLTPEVMIWVVLAMGLFTDRPIRQVFKASRRLHKHETTPGRSSLCEARQRLGVEPLRVLHQQVVRPLGTSLMPSAFYKNMRLMGLDGTLLDVPDREANAKAFGRPTGGRGDGAFPQVRKVSLVELGTHIEVALEIGGYHEGEQTLARRLWKYLPTDSLLLEDRGFFAFTDWKSLLEQKVELLVRCKMQFILRPIKHLSDNSYLAKIYPSSYWRDRDRHGIDVRVIEYHLDDPQRTGHDEVHRLLTTLLDAELHPAEELILLYHERWEEELVFDQQKTHQDPRRAEKPAHLRSETPDGVKQELYALSLAHFVTRKMMLDAAQSVSLDVDRLSFKGCFQILQSRLPECDATSPQARTSWYEAVVWEMSEERIPERRNRINPRVIKRKISKWPKKRPHHRRPPPLTKTFAESIVMSN